MKDYLCIGQVLDLKKYDRPRGRLRDFENREFFIISAKSTKGKDKDGFSLLIEDQGCNRHSVSTYSAVVRQQLMDLLLRSEHEDGVFSIPIKCKLQVTPVKNRAGAYSERFKLV